MGDDQRGPPRQHSRQRLLNFPFALRIQAAGCLVQHQDRRVLQYRSGQAQTLPLTPTEPNSTLADPGLITLGHCPDELGCIGDLRCFDHFTEGRHRASVGDIIQHRAAEQQRFLRHQSKLLVHFVQRELIHVRLVEKNLS